MQQVMFTRDAEKLAISVLEIYEDEYQEERPCSRKIHFRTLWFRQSRNYEESQRASKGFLRQTNLLFPAGL
jgi:hypothetical protein